MVRWGIGRARQFQMGFAGGFGESGVGEKMQ